MKLRSRFWTLAGTAMAFVLSPAMADLPPALDRVPSDAVIVVSVKNIGQLKSGVDAIAKAMGVPADAMGQLMKFNEMLKMPGADSSGSAAMGIMSLEGDEENDQSVVVMSVKDYPAFVKNFGGTGNGLEELKIDESPVFVKNLDGGFAAMGPNRAAVEKFAGKGGNAKAHEAMIGANGKAIAESDDVVVFANIAKLGDKLKEGAEMVKGQMGMAMAMAGGGGGEPNFAVMDKFIDGFVRDASVGILGLKVGESGMALDLGAQFKEGSEYGGYFNAKGNAGSLLAKLPKQPFLFAMALDNSSPELRKAMANIRENMKKLSQEKAEATPGMFPTDWTNNTDGIAFQIGASPAPVGGLFLNTVAYMRTKDAAGLSKQFKDSITGVNGKTVEGVSFTTTYDAGVKVGSSTADAWTMKMQGDPNDQKGAMVGQINFLLFGPNGLSGYMAPTEGGMVMTYAKNAQLLEQALGSAKGGDSMSADADVKKISDSLPGDRTLEAYIGTKSLLDTALGFAGMAGMAPANFNVPDDVPPMGLAATTHSGGVRLTIVVPTKVMLTFKALGESMEQGGGDDMKPADDKAGQPKF